MLVGQLDSTIEHGYYPKIITDVLAYLTTLELDTLALGRHELPFCASDRAWFVILEYHTQPADKFLPEVHRYHSDLQIMLSGSEVMTWALDTGDSEAAQDYLVERDLQYLKPDNLKLNSFVALENQFYLFSPNTIHVSNIVDGSRAKVRKLVVKIHNDLLVA